MAVFLFLLHVVVGFAQLFAIIDALEFYTPLPSIVCAILAIITTWIPGLGALLGILGAVKVWDWSWVQAGLLFFWFIPVMLAVGIWALVSGLAHRDA